MTYMQRRRASHRFAAQVAALVTTGVCLLGMATASGAMDFANMPVNTWVQEPRPAFAPRDNSGWISTAFSPELGQLLFFGLDSTGSGQTCPGSIGYCNDVWLFSLGENRWTNQFPGNTDLTGATSPGVPAPRHVYGGITWDSTRKVWILWGGGNRNGSFSDTWTYDPVRDQWTRKIPNSTNCNTVPPYRRGTITYDPSADRVVLFSGGGSGACGNPSPNMTFLYNPASNAWTQVFPSASPPSRYGHVAAYDSRRRRVTIFGSNDDLTSARNDLWAYTTSTSTWTQIVPSGTPPSPRGSSGFAYDSINDVFLLFGGRVTEDGGAPLNDTWVYNSSANTWTRFFPSTVPTSLTFNDVLEYDPTRNVFVLFTDSGMWYFRYAGGLPDPTTPLPPTSLRVR